MLTNGKDPDVYTVCPFTFRDEVTKITGPGPGESVTESQI